MPRLLFTKLTIMVGRHIPNALPVPPHTRLLRFPETGLHPLDQFEVAKELAESQERLLVITHSPSLLFAICRCVRDRQLPADAVSIHEFVEPGVTISYSVSTEGIVEPDWPRGFREAQSALYGDFAEVYGG